MQKPYWANKQIIKIRAPRDYQLNHGYKISFMLNIKYFKRRVCVSLGRVLKSFVSTCVFVCLCVFACPCKCVLVSVGGRNICLLAASFP